MKTTKDYTNSPAKNFDAVNDIMDYLGKKKYNEVVKSGIGQITDPNHFSFLCMIAGIEGFPVIAWYDHFHGQGAFDKAFAKLEGKSND
jgi:hypothetical protein